jgi:hypothetical protein
MNDASRLPTHMLELRELTPEAFAPYGQLIAPLRTGGQGAETGYDPEASASEAQLVLGNGVLRLWIMHLPHVGLGFMRIARHRRSPNAWARSAARNGSSALRPPAISATTPALGSRTLSRSGCPVIGWSNCMSRPGMPGRISSTTNACFSTWRTSTPTGAIFTPCHCHSNADIDSEAGAEPTPGRGATRGY